MEKTNALRPRSEVPVEDTWATEDLFPTDEAWRQALGEAKDAGMALADYEGRLGGDAGTLYAYLSEMERVDELFSRLGNYCARKADVDTRDPVYQAMRGEFARVAVAVRTAGSFETTEILAIPDETLERFYHVCPDLDRYRRYLTRIRRRKDHILSPAEEKLLAAAGEITGVADDVYSTFTNADLTFPDVVDSQGGVHTLTQATFVPLEESPDRVLRKNAYEALYGRFAQYGNTTAALLNAQEKELRFFAEARKYESSLEAALDRTEVPVSVYHNLIETVHQNLDKMHRYIRLRKKLLGYDELHFYDLYTQLVPGVDRYISFEEAKKTVYEALAPLGEDYRRILKEGFENRWIDVYPNVGKRSGAYSAGGAVHPYVLLNHTGTLDNQFTLAHEMGHALHSYHSNRAQNPIDADYVIFVAEVASTCNEALLMEYLLGRTRDKKERAYLINHFLDQFRGTLYRQTMFAEFERTMGELVRQGKTLTAKLLTEEYGKLNRLYYGPDIVVDDQISVEWARIPHFYYNYYVFQYATGYSAAIALSRRILREGESAVKDYLRFLSGGSTKDPISLLRDAGVDMDSPAPVNQALQLFGELLDEMEALMA